MGLFSCAGERAGVGNGAEVAELVKFDKAVISRQLSVISKNSVRFELKTEPEDRILFSPYRQYLSILSELDIGTIQALGVFCS